MSGTYHFIAMVAMRVDEKSMWDTKKVKVDTRCTCVKETPGEFDDSMNFCHSCGHKIGKIETKKIRVLKKPLRKYFNIDPAADIDDEECVFFDSFKGPRLNTHTIECCVWDEDKQTLLAGVTIASSWSDEGDEVTKPPKWPTKAQLTQYLKKIGFKPLPNTYAFYQFCRYA